MGITIFKNFIWGGIFRGSPYSECSWGGGGERVYRRLYGRKFRFTATPQVISDHIIDDIPPQMNILNMVIPILIHFLIFIRQRHVLHQTEASAAT